MKTCTKCKVTKALNEFSFRTRAGDGKDYQCKACRAAYGKEWRIKNADKHRDGRLKYSYNIGLDDYNAMLEAQGHCCAVCRTDTPGGRGTWHVDHCHTNGHVRGLLCTSCNVGLGHFNDNISTLSNAIAYLSRTAQSQA